MPSLLPSLADSRKTMVTRSAIRGEAAAEAAPDREGPRRWPDAIEQAKRRLAERHGRWLKEHDAAALLQRPEHRWRVRLILRHLRDVRGRVLDMGCFCGIVGERLVSQGGKQIIGVDALPPAIAQAEARGLSTILADLDDGLPGLPDGEFDAIVATDVLQHVLDPRGVLAEAYRLLRPGGRLVVTVPNLACLQNRWRALRGRAPVRLSGAGLAEAHWWAFDTAGLRALLEDVGFEEPRIEADVVMLAPDGARAARLSGQRWLARLAPGLGRNLVAVASRRD